MPTPKRLSVAKPPVAHAQQHGHTVEAEAKICHDQVEYAVPVEVPHRDRDRLGAYPEAALRGEGPVAQPQQHRHGIGASIRHGEVEHAVPVEVSHRERIRGAGHREAALRAKDPVAQAE